MPLIIKRLYSFCCSYDAFSKLIHKEQKLFLISLAFLFVPLFVSIIYAHFNPDIIYTISSDQQVSTLKRNFDPGLSSSRVSTDMSTDLSMLQFYIINNTAMGLRIFIAGILLGIGTLLLLAYQGASMGLLMGFIAQVGYGETLWPFIIGHSSLELLAATFSGVAGLMIGRSLIKPQLESRLKSFTVSFRSALIYVLLATLLYSFAAIIETFWSSNINIASWAKYLFGSTLWAIIIYHFYFAFNKRESH